MYNSRAAFCSMGIVLSLCILSSNVLANNLNISNVRLGSRDPSVKTVTVLFDVAWDNSWRNKINHDAAWVTVRLSDSQALTGEKDLCRLSVAGVSPSGSLSGSNANAQVYVPQDKMGAFIRPLAHQPVSSFSSRNVMLTIDTSSCAFSEDAKIVANVTGLEMVFIPEGSFYAGDFAVSQASLRQGSADNEPWDISSEAAPVPVSAAVNDGFFYVSGGNAGEFATGASFVIPQGFPKGYGAFYAMKYEITEGQWAEFINSLPPGQRPAHDLTDMAHKNSDAVLFRNTIACSGSSLTCTTQRPARALNYLGWKDLAAFLDWAGLRPMTELEYEKASRGPFVPVSGEYAWGSSMITSVAQLSGVVEPGDETVLTPDANAYFGDQPLAGGDSLNGLEYQKGPLRAGIFSTETSTRLSSGAGNYGMMELSGNLKEWAVTIGNAQGLAFTGMNGNGYLTTMAGFSGNADVEGWPGMDVNAAKGITSSAGAGFRGGSWQDGAERLRISDRSEAALGAQDASPVDGGRGARTMDGQ